MKWTRITISTSTEAEDVLVSALADIGIEGVEIEDHVPLTQAELDQMFVDIMPAGPADDGTAKLHFYLGEEQNISKTLKQVEEILEETRSYMDIGEGTITQSETEDTDWINNWKQYFHQFFVDDILIVPSWEEPRDAEKASFLLHIDPGTAFGTGMHETTQLVIRQIKKRVKPGDRVLDVGTGSGILGIVALKCGAASVFATDLDPCCTGAVADNLKANDVSEDLFTFRLGNLTGDQALKEEAGFACYDLVVANILADILVHLTPSLVDHMKSGALYVTSGILLEKENLVRGAMEKAGLTVIEVTTQGDWCCVVGRKD